MRKVSVVEPAGFKSGFGLNCLDMTGGVGGGSTLSVSVALPPANVSLESIGSLTFKFRPTLVETTLTESVQVALAANAPPVNKSIAGFPDSSPQVPLQPELTNVPATAVIPAGSSSRKVTPLKALETLGLASAKVRVETSPTRTSSGTNCLLSVGGLGGVPRFGVQMVPDPLKLILWIRISILGLLAP